MRDKTLFLSFIHVYIEVINTIHKTSFTHTTHTSFNVWYDHRISENLFVILDFLSP